MSRRRVTLQTLADAVGVSRATASNAFSRPDQLSADLRDRILRTAADLGYSGPDPLARGLRSGRLGVTGVLITGSMGHALADSYARELLVGVSEVGQEAGTSLLLMPLPHGHDSVRAVQGAAVDGFVGLALPHGHPALAAVRARGIPLVTVDSPRLAGVPFVGIDDAAAGADMATHLTDAGHRRVAVLSIPLSPDPHVGPVDEARLRSVPYPLSRARLAGVLDALGAAGLSGDEVQVHECGPDHEIDARRAMDRLWASPERPTAVAALSDRIALTVLAWAAENGVAVPADLSVIGFDDVPEAAIAGLTTIRQPAREKARTAARLLGDAHAPAATVLAHTLVTRASVGPSRH